MANKEEESFKMKTINKSKSVAKEAKEAKVNFTSATTENKFGRKYISPLPMEPQNSGTLPNQGQTLRDYFEINPPSILKYFDEAPPPANAIEKNSSENGKDDKDEAQPKVGITSPHSNSTATLASTANAVFKTMSVRGSKTADHRLPNVIVERSTLNQLFEAHHPLDVCYGPSKVTIDYPHNKQDCSEIGEDVRCFWQAPLTDNEQQLIQTMPGLMSEKELTDRICATVLSHLGPEELAKRNIPTADSVSQSAEGLLELINKGCYRAAINLCGRLLTKYGQGYGRNNQPTKHSPHSLQLWFTRLSLLAKIGEFELLQAEGQPFLQLANSDIFFESYPNMYPERKGSMACFSFRILLAELPIYSGNLLQALNNLSALFAATGEIKNYFSQAGSKSSTAFWRKREIRVLHSIINCSLMMKMFNLIDDFMNEMLFENKDLTKDERRGLFSAWGRIYLQSGDIFGAEQKFAESRRLRESQAVDLRDLVDKGLVQVAKNDFPGAFALFQKALQLDSSNLMILNNMGVCLLYAGKLKDAIHLFERSIHRDPRKMLHESLLVNLSTLYELESPDPLAKKLSLLRLVNKFTPDLNMSLEVCLKLN